MVNQLIKIEKNGKIYIPSEIREKLGKKFFIVPYPDKIVLYNVPDDPVGDLVKIGEKIKDISLEKLKEDINNKAYHDLR